jgi:hypothetical protein
MIRKTLITLGLLAMTSLSGCTVYATAPRLIFTPLNAAYPVYPAYPTVIYVSGFHWGYHGFSGR